MSIEAEAVVLVGAHALDDYRTFFAGVLNNLPQGLFQSAPHDVDADLFIGIATVFGCIEFLEHLSCSHQRYAAAGNNTFFHGCASSMHGIFDARFLLFHFSFSGRPHFDDCNTADELRETFLQFLAIIVGRGLVDLCANRLHASFDVGLLAAAFDDGRVVLVDRDLLGLAEIRQLHRLELDTEIFTDHLAAGQDRNVLEHGLAAITEAWRLNCRHVERAEQLVDHQSGQRFAIHVFSDNQQWLAQLCYLLEQRQEVFHRADFLFVYQGQRVLERSFHALGVRHKIRTEIAAVELHTFHDFKRSFHRAGLFHSDHAVFADLIHRLGNDVADG